jgi:ribosomal protein L1
VVPHAGQPIGVAYSNVLHSVKFFRKSRVETKFDVAIGHVEMTPKQLIQNIKAGTTAVIQQLKRGWANVDEIGIHATMGSYFVLYKSK